MNCLAETKEDIIRKFAYNFYQIKQRCGLPTDEKEDWEIAEEAYESYTRIHNGLDRWKE